MRPIGDAPSLADGELVPAEAADLPALAALVNRAYRGATARVGWTHEADLLDGQRTDVALLAETIGKPGAILLLRAPDGAIHACVHVRPMDVRPMDVRPVAPDRWQLGMLTVAPEMQGRGIGRTVVAAVEARARGADVAAIEMTVIHVRDALIAWYARLGYQPTGRTASFPYGEPRFGLPRRDDLHFVMLEKRL